MIDDKQYSRVEFRSTREPMGKNLLNKLQFKLSSLNVDRQVSFFVFVLGFNKLSVCFFISVQGYIYINDPMINNRCVHKSISLKIRIVSYEKSLGF